jgi:hypothetical protein
MALNKQSVPINFSQGLDLKTDSKQVAPGKFLALSNSVFDKGGQLTKRNGFGMLPDLSDDSNTFITTVGGNLTAVGTSLSAYSQGSKTWVNKGTLQPADVQVLSVVRSNVGQSQADSVTHPNGLTCTVYTDDIPTGGGVLTSSYKYLITDSVTGQRITAPAVIPSAPGSVTQPAKVFLLGNNFIIVFTNMIGSTNALQYVAINVYSPTLIGANTTISANYIPGPAGLAPYFEGVVNNNNLYLAWNSTIGNVEITLLDSTLTLYSPVILTGHQATILSVCVDTSLTNPIVYLVAYDDASGNTTAWAFDKSLYAVLGATTILTETPLVNLTSVATGGVLTAFYEQPGVYGYDIKIATNVVRSVTMTQAGVVSIPLLVDRSVGLASKAFLINGAIYLLVAYISNYQPTYFLINGAGQTIVKLAYSNGASSYYTKGLATPTVSGTVVKFAYLTKDLIESVNKTQGLANAGGIYSQTGVNTATINITAKGASSAEIAKDLHITGGFMWMYDGSTPVEHSFHLWPDYVETSLNLGGAMAPQKHYYSATYEWTDAQGNIFRSAPSIPILGDTSSIDGRGVNFSATFAIGDTTFTVSSVDNLYIGQPIFDVSNKGAFPANTKITAVGTTTITVNNAALAASAPTHGDNMATSTIAASATFTANSFTAQMNSVNGFLLGQTVTDTFTPGNLSPNTIITGIDPVKNQLTLSQKTVGSSAADKISASSTTAQAYFTAGATTLRVTNIDGFGVGGLLADSTVSGAFQPNTRITAIDLVNYIITIDKPTVSASGGPPVLYNQPAGDFSGAILRPDGTTLYAFGLFTVLPPYVTPVVGQGIIWSHGAFQPNLNIVSSFTSNTVSGSLPPPHGNTFDNGPYNLYLVDMHTISQAGSVLQATFLPGATTLNVSSTINLGVGMILSDLTTPGNIAAGTKITGVNAPNNTITIDTPTPGGTVPSILQTIDVFAVTINVPTLRLTYKTANPVRISIYRWSQAQQNYYQVTPVLNPILNNVNADYITYTDIASDSTILGNSLLYTTGGVVENIAAPPVSAFTLYGSRLFAINAEDRNSIWYSKQVIENVPVDMSDLFTIYIAPTTAAQGDTGPITALSTLDDKLIIFKRNAIYYLTGSGPDNTGAQNSFSEPVYIMTSVGCINPKSIVFCPSGLIFESEKGLWLLGRDLSTSYIGAPVEALTLNTHVTSAIAIEGTNQVRLMLETGVTLMYDYYFQQWGTFSSLSGISGTNYQTLHTYINGSGQVFQETPGLYLDGGHPVLLSFTTSWLNLGGLQGYERAYFFYMLGIFQTPHRLSLQIAYDYNPSPTQTSIIAPANYVAPWGGEQLWGSGGNYGGNNVEQWRIFLQKQKCQAFQITMSELYDPALGVVSGAGLTLSGLNVQVGLKDSKPRLSSSRSVG